jgi:hypothetical protein
MWTQVKVLEGVGFNASFFWNGSQYAGTYREEIHLKENVQNHTYPEKHNLLHFFTMNASFETNVKGEIKDIGRVHHRNWTSGFEDARLLDEQSCLAVTCDTNPFWKSDITYVKFNEHLQTTSLTPLEIAGFDRTHRMEKNWLVLQRWKSCVDEVHILHSCSPLRVLRCDLQTGKGNVIVEKENPYIPRPFHNGAVLRCQQGFLVTGRVKEGYGYKHSMWILLDVDYNVKAVSNPFRFAENESYEMCMSLRQVGSHVYACVGLSDRCSAVFCTTMDKIMNSLTFIF